MGWKNILIILAVIAAIHLLVILCFVGGGNSDKSAAKKDEAPAAQKAEESAGVMRRVLDALQKKRTEQPGKPRMDGKDGRIGKPGKIVPPPVAKVVPWKRSGGAALPAKLQKQAGRAKSVILVDLRSRRILWEKNAEQPVAVASLTKLMSAILIAEKLECDPEFSLDTPIPVTKAATSVERSRVLGLREGEKCTVRDLLTAMMIGSYNDAAAQLAEATGGSVEGFVKMMNARGRAMGLTSVNFNSPNGLPQGKGRVNSFASASDILHLCEELMKHKEVFPLCRLSHASLSSGKEVWTSNNLLLAPSKAKPYRRVVPGIIGFKTGYTNAAGSCLAFGVEREGRTILGCVTGFPSQADRDRFCGELIEWSFQKPKAAK